MRPFLACLLVAVLPAALFASPEPFCEDKVSRTGRLFGRPAYYDLEEKLPGYLRIDENRFLGNLADNAFWTLEGTFEEKIPIDPTVIGGLLYTFNRPEDFNGPFHGWFGRGQTTIKWESGATIQGHSPVGDYEVRGIGRVHMRY